MLVKPLETRIWILDAHPCSDDICVVAVVSGKARERLGGLDGIVLGRLLVGRLRVVVAVGPLAGVCNNAMRLEKVVGLEALERQRLLGRRKRRVIVLAARLLASERPEKPELVSVRTVCRGDFALADTGNMVFGPFLVPVAELRPPWHGAEGEDLLVDIDAQLRVRLDVIVVEAALEELDGVAELARDLLLLLYLGVKRLAGIGGRRGRSAGNRSGGEYGLENHRLKLHGIRSFP